MSIERVAQEIRHAALAAGLAVALMAPGPLSATSQTGRITGTVTTKAAGARPLRITIDQRVCGNELPDEAIVTDGAGRLANAVVTLTGVLARQATPGRSIMNEKCRFSPRVQIVRPNSSITTSSTDPILHTTNAQLDGGKVLFNVAVPVPGIKISKAVTSRGLVRLSCNTHPWMRGWLLVTDEAAAVTGADGVFALNDVPPGTYDLRVWHESLKGATQKVTVTPDRPLTVNFELR
jgi:hypothetical protein